MPLGDTNTAAGESATAVPMLKRSPKSRRDRPGARPDFYQSAVAVLPHHHAAGVAGEPLRRFRGKAYAILED
jgi:hypothetical protein